MSPESLDPNSALPRTNDVGYIDDLEAQAAARRADQAAQAKNGLIYDHDHVKPLPRERVESQQKPEAVNPPERPDEESATSHAA